MLQFYKNKLVLKSFLCALVINHARSHLQLVRAHLYTNLHEIWNTSSQDSSRPPHKIRAFVAEIFAKQYLCFLIIDFQCIFHIMAITGRCQKHPQGPSILGGVQTICRIFRGGQSFLFPFRGGGSWWNWQKMSMKWSKTGLNYHF